MSQSTRAATAALVFFVVALAADKALAHSGTGLPISTRLLTLEPAWDGVTVQLRSTLAPQILLANHSAKTIEILDAAGRAFLRFAPQGVFADFATAAWYNTYSTARLTVPPYARDPAAPPRWQRISDENQWGWFDPRLATTGVKIPAEVVVADVSTGFGAWSVPARIDDQPTAIEGEYRYSPLGQAPASARLLAPGQIAPQVFIALVPGPVDGLTLDNRSDQIVTVLGLDDEPYLRIRPSGVDANLASRTWREWGRSAADAPALHSEQTLLWQAVAGGHRYTWLEPRTRMGAAPDDTGEHPWSVTLLIGDRPVQIPGVTSR